MRWLWGADMDGTEKYQGMLQLRMRVASFGSFPSINLL